jgi:hypothetical protein
VIVYLVDAIAAIAIRIAHGNPTRPIAGDYHDWLGLLLATRGRFDEGLQQVALAHANDPSWPSVYSMEGELANLARRDLKLLLSSDPSQVFQIRGEGFRDCSVVNVQPLFSRCN